MNNKCESLLLRELMNVCRRIHREILTSISGNIQILPATLILLQPHDEPVMNAKRIKDRWKCDDRKEDEEQRKEEMETRWRRSDGRRIKPPLICFLTCFLWMKVSQLRSACRLWGRLKRTYCSTLPGNFELLIVKFNSLQQRRSMNHRLALIAAARRASQHMAADLWRSEFWSSHNDPSLTLMCGVWCLVFAAPLNHGWRWRSLHY